MDKIENKITAWENLKLNVVDKELCIGCGTCAGVCPVNVLAMDFNIYGQYEPALIGKCTNCGLCDKSCPFINSADNEDTLGDIKFKDIENIQYNKNTGYFLDTFVGFAPEENTRWNGSSGGVLSWLLSELLNKKIVDRVISVGSNPDSDKLYKYQVFSNSKEVLENSKSAYYPVELSDVIKEIKKNDQSYAIVGLPCFVKGIELAKKKNIRLRKRIKYIFGLVCGKNKSKLYTNQLINLLGSKQKEVKSAIYRDKKNTQKASDYNFTIKNKTGEEKSFLWSKGVLKYWITPTFDMKACWLCDDIFSELSDAVFMDAWLPEYINDNKGTSLIISRNKKISKILKEFMEVIPIEEIVKSQYGVVKNKRRNMSLKLSMFNSDLTKRPAKFLYSKKHKLSGIVEIFLLKRAFEYYTKQRNKILQLNGNIDIQKTHKTLTKYYITRRFFDVIYYFLNKLKL